MKKCSGNANDELLSRKGVVVGLDERVDVQLKYPGVRGNEKSFHKAMPNDPMDSCCLRTNVVPHVQIPLQLNVIVSFHPHLPNHHRFAVFCLGQELGMFVGYSR